MTFPDMRAVNNLNNKLPKQDIGECFLTKISFEFTFRKGNKNKR
jgi:hypothetical protein